MGFFDKQKEKIFDNVNEVALKVLRENILQLLGEDAREEDVNVIKKYFDSGIASRQVKEALKEAKIL